MRTLAAILCVSLAASLGCFGSRKLTWEEKMDSSAGVERAQAVMELGERNDWSAIPQFIDRLEDDDTTVRMMAAGVLRDMTGKELGYNAYGDEKERRDAVGRWREWWKTEGVRGRAALKAGGKP